MVEGGTATIPVYVSGSPTDSITVPYTIGGTATPGRDHGAADGSIVIDGVVSEISFPVYSDAEDDDGETVVIQLGQPTHAELGGKTTQTLTISEHDRFITARLATGDTLPGETHLSHLYLLPGCCTGEGQPLVIKADGRANFPAGMLQYDWSGTDAKFLAYATASGNSLSFYPNRDDVPEGVYTVRVRIKSLDHPEVSADAELPLRVVKDFDVASVNGAHDSDSDGRPDLQEALFVDDNENGIENIFDAFWESNILQVRTQLANVGVHTFDETLDDGTRVSLEWDGFIDPALAEARSALSSDTGTRLRLGRVAFLLGREGATVPLADFKETAANINPQQLQSADELLGDAVLDVEVTGLPAPGQSAHIVMPRVAPPRGSVVWTFSPARGWGKFHSDPRNALDSAAGRKLGDKLYSCPGTDNSTFAAGVAGECVRLTVQDGGPNDADGVADGVIKLLVAEGPDLDENGATASSGEASTTGGSTGGGGAIGLLALLFGGAGMLRGRLKEPEEPVPPLPNAT